MARKFKKKVIKKKNNQLLIVYISLSRLVSISLVSSCCTRETSTSLTPLCLFAMCTKLTSVPFLHEALRLLDLFFVCPLSRFVNDLFVYFLQTSMVSLGVTSKSHRVLVSSKPKTLGISAMARYLLTGNVGLIFCFSAILF